MSLTNTKGGMVIFWFWFFLRRPRHLREDPLQPPSCGADDFSEGAEHLTQKVLWETKEQRSEEEGEEKNLDQRGEFRFPRGGRAITGEEKISCNYKRMSNKFLEAVAVGFSARAEGGLGEGSRSRE